MKQTLKNIFFRISALFPQEMNGKASILMYHSVSTASGYFFTVSPAEFRKQMHFLGQKGREVITLTELLERSQKHSIRGGEVVLTFDDGYRDNFTEAFPVLKEYSYPATIFVTTGLVGKKDARGAEMLTEEDLREMHMSGIIDIEPHSVTHPKLSSLDRESAKKQIAGSKLYLEQLLGKTCDIFAYPFGNYGNETVEIVRGLGFRAAVTVIEGSVVSGADLLRLNRNSIDKLTSLTQFLGKISRSVDWYHNLKRS